MKSVFFQFGEKICLHRKWSGMGCRENSVRRDRLWRYDGEI